MQVKNLFSSAVSKKSVQSGNPVQEALFPYVMYSFNVVLATLKLSTAITVELIGLNCNPQTREELMLLSH